MEEAAFATACLLQEGRIAEVPSLLADSQDAAVALGSHIEKLYGLQTQTVAALELYCNALYQVSVAMDEASLIGLAESIEQIYAIYDAEFPEKKEIVFLPYNASMWDSLESVWMAAKEDETCEVYVVPIPYYNLDGNHSVKELHYEGDLYPEYVPITSYESYDLELHHPDMIFIHNPYDDCNTVTSVVPEFYSSRIKEFTDCLVYIPYFVLAETDSENQSQVDEIKHFCTLPGVIHADKVIVQSENIRHIYINEYRKAVKASGGEITQNYLEEKILGLGSPKFDKAINTKKDELQIPEEWLRIIQKEDGTWKKIIFYNTSIAAFLKQGEKMLAKIKDVLHTFKENREEVVLLWRPHPLMMSTIESMRSDLRDEYSSIINQYREESWGIYDDTADMDRAVVLSDAYYGDYSSVLQVYQETGKPFMVQNVNTLAEDSWQKNALSYFAYIDIDNVRWVSNLRFNGLYAIDLETNETKFYGRFSGAAINSRGLHSFVRKYEDILIFFPQEGSVINLFNMKTYEMSHVELGAWGNQRSTVSGVVQKNETFFLFPRYKDLPVLEFCVTNKEVRIAHTLSKSLQASDISVNELTRNICCINDTVWFCLYGTNKVVSLDLNTKEEIIYTLEGVEHLQCISSLGEDIWLGSEGDVLRWEVNTDVLTRVPNVIEEKKDKENEIVSILCTEKKVVIIPRWSGWISIIDREELTINKHDLKVEELVKVKDGIVEWRDFKEARLVGDVLELHPVSYAQQIELNLKSGVMITHKFCADEISSRILDLEVQKSYEENFRLESFLLEICKYDKDAVKLSGMQSGINIFQKVIV